MSKFKVGDTVKLVGPLKDNIPSSYIFPEVFKAYVGEKFRVIDSGPLDGNARVEPLDTSKKLFTRTLFYDGELDYAQEDWDE